MARSNREFLLGLVLAGLLIFFGVKALGEGYYLLVAFYILQYVVLATAWNILGGYGGYVNFGSACFFALSASKPALVPLPPSSSSSSSR